MNVSHESTGNFEDFKFDRLCTECFVRLIMILITQFVVTIVSW